MANQTEPEKGKGELPVREAVEAEPRRTEQEQQRQAAASAQGQAQQGAPAPQPPSDERHVSCRDIMKSDVATISPSATLEEAARCMRERNIGFLPVCDEEGKVVGTLTDRDITIRAIAEGRDPHECHVDEVSSHEVVACRPDDPLDRAEQMMVDFHKSRVLLTNPEGRIEGVISLSDIAECESETRASFVLRNVASREARL